MRPTASGASAERGERPRARRAPGARRATGPRRAERTTGRNAAGRAGVGLTRRRAQRTHVPDANRLVLDATLTERGDLRYTPAGLPALECMLRHASTQPEAGGERRVECELAAVAFGAPAESLARIANGTELRCKGFIARRWRTGITVALHVHEFELLNHD